MISDVTRFPMNTWERIKNRRGGRSVSCIVTERWLRFAEDTGPTPDGPAVLLEVFTDVNERDRKLCELLIPIEELERAIGNVNVKK